MPIFYLWERAFCRLRMPRRQFPPGLRLSLKAVVIKEESIKYHDLRKRNSITKSDMSKNVMVLAMNVIEFIKISGRFEKNLVKINFLFIVIFLNIWDFMISR